VSRIFYFINFIVSQGLIHVSLTYIFSRAAKQEQKEVRWFDVDERGKV
jgi:hypothetical protein